MAFDGIEFNEEFQWINVLSEIAFPVMDFVAQGRPELGWRLLNAYLEATGDYQALDVLRFYLVYRAMVRAKVSWLNPNNHESKADQNLEDVPLDSNQPLDLESNAGPWDRYLRAAEYFAFGIKPDLAIMHGFSGSGKSTTAMEIIDGKGGIRIRADAERIRLAEKFKTDDKYSAVMNDWVYRYLLEIAEASLNAGFPTIVDATFLKLHHRELFLDLAQKLNLRFEIVDCDATFDQLCDRIKTRGPDLSEATINVLTMQMETHEPLTTDELQYLSQRHRT